MDRANVDTDQIIPKQFLKRIERTGFGQFLFHDWRYLEDGSDNPDFELHHPQSAGASILIARQNFGSGSSREHAVWALDDYGIRAVIAPGFADIFYNNCFKNGLLPITLDERTVDELFRRASANRPYQLTVDLQACTISDEHGLSLSLEINASRRHKLLHGLDDITLTLQHEEKIDAYELSRGLSPRGEFPMTHSE